MMATARAMLKPCSPPGSPQPSMRSPMSAGSSWGTLARAAAIIWRTASSGRMVVRDPLKALPIGDLAVATITASGMAAPSVPLGYWSVAYDSVPPWQIVPSPFHDHDDGQGPGVVMIMVLCPSGGSYHHDHHTGGGPGRAGTPLVACRAPRSTGTGLGHRAGGIASVQHDRQ